MANDVTTKNVRRALVMYDPDTNVSGGNRWFDAFGHGVVKYLNEFTHLAVDDTTHDPTEFTNTIVETGGGGDSTVTVTDRAGGALLITTDNAENDGYKMQLGHGAGGAGENVMFDGPYQTYFGVRFAINDVDQTDCLFGFCITDTACLDAVSDGMYFRSVDGSASLNFVLEKNSTEASSNVATLTDNTYVTAEFYYDGSNVYAYADGTLMATVADTSASFPDDEALRLTIEFLTGEATANTCTIEWIRFIHIRG